MNPPDRPLRRGVLAARDMESLVMAASFTAITWAFAQSNDLPVWVWLAEFVILLVAGLGWNRVLRRETANDQGGEGVRRRLALTWSLSAGAVLLVIVAVVFL